MTQRRNRPDLAALRERGGYVDKHANRPTPVAEEAAATGGVRDWWVPIGLIAFGILGRAVQGAITSGAAGTGLAVLEALFAVGAALGAFFIASRFFDSDWGEVGPALLKIAAIALLGLVLGSITGTLDPQPDDPTRDQLVAVHVIFITWFFGIAALFRSDLLETLMLTVIVAAAEFAALLTLYVTAGRTAAALALTLS
jgi:hypothetical protein